MRNGIAMILIFQSISLSICIAQEIELDTCISSYIVNGMFSDLDRSILKQDTLLILKIDGRYAPKNGKSKQMNIMSQYKGGTLRVNVDDTSLYSIERYKYILVPCRCTMMISGGDGNFNPTVIYQFYVADRRNGKRYVPAKKQYAAYPFKNLKRSMYKLNKEWYKKK